MPLDTITLQRPLTSYAKVQTWIGHLIRNRAFQLRRPRVLASHYLDVGCGPNTHENFINLDYLWHPQVDVCWDVRRGLPFATGSLRGIFSEHCLEHFQLSDGLALLRECRRVLMPAGVARIVVPDGELYLRTYVDQLAGETRRFPYQAEESRLPLWTPMASVNRVFYQDRESAYGHRIIYDFQLLQTALHECGFAQVVRQGFGRGSDPHLLIDTPDRQVESLYVEAWGAR